MATRNLSGCDDMVMLSKLTNESILENLRKRYSDEIIYTYIGHVLIAMNPYRIIKDLYSEKTLRRYRGKYPYEEPPHVYALADDMYRHMLSEATNHCVIISGESGAGKTETSKLIMQYVAAVSGRGTEVTRVKDVILESNPLLEAFGNAKTVRNNNSSRFGKYMEIQFDLCGDPTGGKITNYLLEKSRVVYQAPGERNFHSYYLLLAGADDALRRELRLGKASDYHYTRQGNASVIDGVDDRAQFQEVVHAMEVMGIPPKEQKEVWTIVAAILTIGNITFVQNDKDEAAVADRSVMATAALLMGVDEAHLDHVLTHRTISTGTAGRSARVSTYASPHNAASAEYARDALAKAMYSRLFDWIVACVNKAMGWRTGEGYITLSLLDIYGFEIFGRNGFEQLCINYVNEKLQQIFIELTLKSEQEEYRAEGIQWEDVDYFNNKICCDLIEGQKPAGLLRVLDDVCTMPMGTDEKFLQQAADTHAGHAHFVPFPQQNEFNIRHYAGDVSYRVDGFLDKNRDTLFYDHIDLCGTSRNTVLSSVFPEAGQTDRDKKRPTTAGFKIKQSIADLVGELSKCKMHYIRCIKPNDTKSPMTFDAERVMHQVKYLGLLENTRIRRAGYAFRETYEKFFFRFRVCCHETWPKWNGPGGFEGGSEAIIRSIVTPGEKNPYAKGKTKIFIRMPETVFALEELRDRTVQIYANRLQRFFLQFTLQNYYYMLHKTVNERLAGKKERRPGSIQLDAASFRGDYVNYRDNFALKQVLQAYGHERVAFSHAVTKHYVIVGLAGFSISRSQRRVMVLTDQAVYLCAIEQNPDKTLRPKKPFIYELRRRIELREITAVSLSTLKDNFVVIHAHPDVLLEIRRKTEFLALLLKYLPQLAINFSNKITMMDKGTKSHTVTFEKNPQGQSGLLKMGSKVQVEEGLPATSAPNIKPPANIEMTTVGDYYEIRKKAPLQRPQPTPVPRTPAGAAGASSPAAVASSGPPNRQLPTKPSAGPPGRGRALPTPGRGRSLPASPPAAQPTSSSVGRTSGRASGRASPAAVGRASPSAGRTAGAPATGRATTAAAPAGRAAGRATGRAIPAAPAPTAPAVARARVLYDFKAENPEEIDITEGGTVMITRHVGDWIEGDFNGKHGLFPASYVEEIKTTPSPPARSPGPGRGRGNV